MTDATILPYPDSEAKRFRRSNIAQTPVWEAPRHPAPFQMPEKVEVVTPAKDTYFVPGSHITRENTFSFIGRAEVAQSTNDGQMLWGLAWGMLLPQTFLLLLGGSVVVTITLYSH